MSVEIVTDRLIAPARVPAERYIIMWLLPVEFIADMRLSIWASSYPLPEVLAI